MEITDKTASRPPGASGTCSSCGAVRQRGSKFCAECGHAFRVAGSRSTFGPRYAALLVDLSAMLGLWFLIQLFSRPISGLLVTSYAGVKLDPGTLISIVLVPLIAFLYFAVGDRKGQTVGQRSVGIRLQRVSGEPPGLGASTLRSAVMWGPLMLILFGELVGGLGNDGLGRGLVTVGAPLFAIVWVANLVMALTPRFRRGLQDLAAGTEMVRD